MGRRSAAGDAGSARFKRVAVSIEAVGCEGEAWEGRPPEDGESVLIDVRLFLRLISPEEYWVATPPQILGVLRTAQEALVFMFEHGSHGDDRVPHLRCTR